jgi:hypothetical protein
MLLDLHLRAAVGSAEPARPVVVETEFAIEVGQPGRIGDTDPHPEQAVESHQ